MPATTLFTMYNTAILLPWLLLLFLPNWKGTQWMARTQWPVAFLSASYLVFLLWDLFTATNASIDFMSLESIKAAFGRDEVMLIGWVHYLAFDLAVGFWEYRDAQRRAIPHWVLVPCLIFTLMYGPVGFLLYFLVKTRYPKQDQATKTAV